MTDSLIHNVHRIDIKHLYMYTQLNDITYSSIVIVG